MQNEYAFPLKNRIGFLLYGTASYIIFLGVFLYALGFIGNILVPKSIDSDPDHGFWTALMINMGVLGLFAVQHSVMARPAFKNWWTRFVPEPIERSTYVLFSSIAMILLFWLWSPMGGTIWKVDNQVLVVTLHAMCAGGWLLVLVSTFLINHFDLFGMRQVWLYFRNERYRHLPFKTPSLYKNVRHPLYVGWLFAFWATPTMTVAHLVFAIATTAYILIAIQLEERDLADAHPEYEEYRQRVPMLIPSVRGVKNRDTSVESVIADV